MEMQTFHNITMVDCVPPIKGRTETKDGSDLFQCTLYKGRADPEKREPFEIRAEVKVTSVETTRPHESYNTPNNTNILFVGAATCELTNDLEMGEPILKC